MLSSLGPGLLTDVKPAGQLEVVQLDHLGGNKSISTTLIYRVVFITVLRSKIFCNGKLKCPGSSSLFLPFGAKRINPS